MIIDAHYHLEERLETVDRLLEQMSRHHIDRIALIPTMCDPLPQGIVPDRLGAALRSALTGRFRARGLRMYDGMVGPDGDFHMLNKVCLIYRQPDNQRVQQVMQAHPDKFYGWIFVNPKVADPLTEVQKWMGQPGWIGVKAHPFWHRYPVASLDGVADLCAGRGWPLLIHLGSDQASGDYRYLPERHQSLKLMYAHAGVPFYGELWEYAKKKPNVFVDLSSPYLDERLRRQAVRSLGAEKCLYGTDGPYFYPDKDGRYDHGRILGEIGRLTTSDEEKERMLGGNFHQIALQHVPLPR